MSGAVKDILERISRLTPSEREELDTKIARCDDEEAAAACRLSDRELEQEWQKRAERARRMAGERGTDEAAVDRIIHKMRYGS